MCAVGGGVQKEGTSGQKMNKEDGLMHKTQRLLAAKLV